MFHYERKVGDGSLCLISGRFQPEPTGPETSLKSLHSQSFFSFKALVLSMLASSWPGDYSLCLISSLRQIWDLEPAGSLLVFTMYLEALNAIGPTYAMSSLLGLRNVRSSSECG